MRLLLQYSLPLNAIRLKKMGDKAVSKDSFMLKYYHDRHKTEKISDKAVVVFLQGSKFLLDWVVTSKMIQNFTMLYSQKMIYSFLIKILVMLYFLMMKWVFLV